MALSTIRRVTQDDKDAVGAAWTRFSHRHPEADEEWIGDIYSPHEGRTEKVERLWQAVLLGLRRGTSLGHRIVIDSGYVCEDGW